MRANAHVLLLTASLVNFHIKITLKTNQLSVQGFIFEKRHS